jgi:hypothetical protein
MKLEASNANLTSLLDCVSSVSQRRIMRSCPSCFKVFPCIPSNFRFFPMLTCGLPVSAHALD